MTIQADTDRREALRLLLSRSSRGVLLPEEAELLREHVEAEIRAGDQVRALLSETAELFNVTHAYRIQGGHDTLGANLCCAGCALRDRIRTVLDGLHES